MRFEKAIILGVFCKQLGILPEARVEIVPTKEGLRIWDLDSDRQYVLGLDGETLAANEKALPSALMTILTASDATLIDRLSSRQLRKWSDERETIVSELKYRGLLSPDLVIASSQFFSWDLRRESLLKSLSMSGLWQRLVVRRSPAMKQ